MKDVIIAALAKLDPAVDTHWNADGQVNLSTLKFIAGGVAITREQLEEVAPNFTRATPQVDASNEEVKVEGSQDTGGDSEEEVAVPAASTPLWGQQDAFLPAQQLSDEELEQLCAGYLEEIDELNTALQEATNRVNARVRYLHSVKAEQDRRQPKMTLAEMVRKSHELHAQTSVPANMPRARPHTVYPVLNKK